LRVKVVAAVVYPAGFGRVDRCPPKYFPLGQEPGGYFLRLGIRQIFVGELFGVEGTISEAKRTYGVGHTRVRGNDRVEAENYGMILGMNVKRFHNFQLESKRFRKATWG
jgi:hypothetical protein